MTGETLFATLQAAAEFAEISVVVRSAGAIAEVRGPLTVRKGPEWLTLGEEAGSHVHLKGSDVQTIRLSRPTAGNAALELLGEGGALLLRVSFRGTNPARADRFDAERAEKVRDRFGSLGNGESP